MFGRVRQVAALVSGRAACAEAKSAILGCLVGSDVTVDISYIAL